MFVGILISYIHDTLSRRLYDDRDEQRIWCILDTSTKFKIYDRFRNLFHFLIPFVINIVSAIIIIVQVYRTRRTILIEEMKRHQHLLIAPLILIFLSIPRLIISFLFGCMESSHRPWLFIIGYYISFVPSLIIFFVYVLSSRTYKQIFIQCFRHS